MNFKIDKSLQQKADKLLKKGVNSNPVTLEAEIQKLFYLIEVQNIELEIQKVELELHNEELMMIKEALHETNDYLENLVDYAGTPTVVWNPKFRITRFNRAFQLLTGYSVGKVLGQPIEMLFPPAFYESSKTVLRRFLSENPSETVEIQIMCHDKSIRTLLWKTTIMFKSDQRTPIATIGQGQDITNRRMAEVEIIRQKEMFQSIFNAIPLMVTYVDKNKKIRITNQECVRVLGWTIEEWENENILEKCFPDPEVLKEVMDFMDKKNPSWKNFRTVTKDGTEKETQWTNVCLSNGMLIGIGRELNGK